MLWNIANLMKNTFHSNANFLYALYYTKLYNFPCIYVFYFTLPHPSWCLTANIINSSVIELYVHVVWQKKKEENVYAMYPSSAISMTYFSLDATYFFIFHALTCHIKRRQSLKLSWNKWIWVNKLYFLTHFVYFRISYFR